MRKATATLAAALLCGATALQAQSWKAYERTTLQDEAYARHDCVNLLDSTSVTVQPSGQGSFAVCRTVKVQTPAGALRQRVLKYDYDPLTAAARFRRVTVHHADGTKTEVDVSKTLDYAAPARAIYWGARQIMIELGQLKPGDVIDYEIDKKGFTYALLTDMPQDGDDSRFIPPMRGQFYDIVPFWSSDPTVRKVYRVSLPAEKDMQFQFYQGSCASSLRYEDERKVYTFASDGLMPFRREPNMVDFYDAAPKLMMSTTADWREKSRWFHGVNEDYGSFTAIPEAQRKVDELIRGKKTDLEKIAVLTHWVADNIRYAGITMGKGEGFTLHNLKMNYTDRCGVCKDIAGTLIAFLRMAGFEAYPAMTMAGSRVETIPADHFNHCVAVVRLKDGTLMPLDPTWVPFCRELWSSAEQQQNYLPGTPEGTDLCLTPVSAPENHYVRIHADNRLSADGRQPPLRRRYPARLFHHRSRRAERQQYPPHLHHRLPKRVAEHNGAPAAERITQGTPPQRGLRTQPEGLSEGSHPHHLPLRNTRLCPGGRRRRDSLQAFRTEQPLYASDVLPAHRHQSGDTSVWFQRRLFALGGTGRDAPSALGLPTGRRTTSG